MGNLGLDGDMRLESSAKLLHCPHCGCIWQRTFNSRSFKFHDEILGSIRNLNTSPALQMR